MVARQVLRKERQHYTAGGMTKRTYPNGKMAKKAAKLANAHGGKPQHAYRCGLCGEWHTGSTHERRS